MAEFRKKPVVIEAYQWPSDRSKKNEPEWFTNALRSGEIYYQGGDVPYLTIVTLEGNMRASLGDYIIRGVKGELYPCREDIFLATYEPVSE